MISLGENWLLQDRHVYHACGPELVHHWTGGRVCDCGIVVPQRVRAFQRWLRKNERRERLDRSGALTAGQPDPARSTIGTRA